MEVPWRGRDTRASGVPPTPLRFFLDFFNVFGLSSNIAASVNNQPVPCEKLIELHILIVGRSLEVV